MEFERFLIKKESAVKLFSRATTRYVWCYGSVKITPYSTTAHAYSAFVAAWMLLVIALVISSHMSRFVTSTIAIYDITEAL